MANFDRYLLIFLAEGCPKIDYLWDRASRKLQD